MRNQGTCPRCGVRIELGFGPPPPTGSCDACRQRYLVVVPEPSVPETEEPECAAPDAAAPGHVRELELLALREPPRAPTLREARGLGRSAFRSIHALALLPLLVALLVLAVIAVPEAGPLERVAVAVFLILGTLLVIFPLVGVLAMGLVRLLLAGRPARSFWHSVQVVGLGALGLGASFLLVMLATRLPFGGAFQLGGLLSALFLGACTARLAPAEPYRHALVACALYLGLGTLVMLPFGWRMVVAGELAMALSIPPLLLGAWLGLRIAPGPPGAELAP
jgi:hypothetical protein